MATYPNRLHIPYAPTETSELYPESDGKPMAASDLHRNQLIWTLQTIDAYFAHKPDVYISGDIMMYDIEGPQRTAISPDVLVSFGIGKKLRRTYKVWEEGKSPDFVMEFSSESTYQNDLTGKMEHYATMKIPDYLLYDAEARYLPSPIMGFRLMGNNYVEIPPQADGGIHSAVLGLDFHALEAGLGIYDRTAGEWIQTPAEAATARAQQETARAEAATARAQQETARAEAATARAQQETTRAQQETARADQEAAARQKVEAELTQLREELARLKERT